MTVNIDPSEVRNATSTPQPTAQPRLRRPTRAVLIGGLGGAGLLAFSVGAFSFFSTLADPRARTPRPMQAAASMPDLKDGMPTLVNGEAVPTPKAATLNLPRPIVVEPAAAQPAPVVKTAVATPIADPAPVARTAASEPQAPALRSSPTPPPIQNAATLPETRTVTTAAPPARTVATIAPARTETVKAKPVQASAVAPSETREPVKEPTSTATATARPPRTPVAVKPPVQKTAARKTPGTKTVADASDPAPAAASTSTSAASDESDIPGARQFRAGVKAIGGLFGGDGKDD